LPHPALLLVAALAAPGSLQASREPSRLELAKLYVTTGTGARVAPEVEALAGRRVRVVGFMAKMEEYVPRGALYLTRMPVETEEGGGGTGDLPPGALRVEVPHLAEKEIEWIPGAVEVIGTLQVGRAEDEEGRVSWLRVVVEDPPSAAAGAR